MTWNKCDLWTNYFVWHEDHVFLGLEAQESSSRTRKSFLATFWEILTTNAGLWDRGGILSTLLGHGGPLSLVFFNHHPGVSGGLAVSAVLDHPAGRSSILVLVSFTALASTIREEAEVSRQESWI